jgi:hypothetical protein
MTIFDASNKRQWSYDEGNALWVPKTAYVKVSKNADQTISNANLSLLTFGTTIYDPDSMISSSSRILMPWPGLYHINIMIRWASNNAGYRHIGLVNTGVTETIHRQVAVNATNYHHLSATVFAVGTSGYLECNVEQTSGGNLNVEGIGSFDPFMSVAFQSEH